jgi:hypothetical protein
VMGTVGSKNERKTNVPHVGGACHRDVSAPADAIFI